MVNLLFFLKFKSQLRRTRPDLVRQIEELLLRLVADAGGDITGEKPVFHAVFNEDTPGFWLDVFILIEAVKKNMEASGEFYGYALLINRDSDEKSESLCRYLSGYGGVFMDTGAAECFSPYADLEKPEQWLKKGRAHKYGSGGLLRIKELKNFHQTAKKDSHLPKNAVSILDTYRDRNILIVEPAFSFMRIGLFRYLKKVNGDFPALTICFGSEGLGALVDAWSGRLRSLSTEATEEIDSLWEFLFRDRIRSEVSDFIINTAKRFFYLIVNFYVAAAKKKKRIPVLVFENLHLAKKTETDLLIDLLNELTEGKKRDLQIVGIGEESAFQEQLQPWKTFFRTIIKINHEAPDTENFPKLPSDLWEIIYAVSLFGRYFSPELFQRLFEEEEKNPMMIAKAFSILYSSGVIDNTREPWPLNGYFVEQSLKLPEENASRVKSLARRRLVSWAVKKKINPCFDLLLNISALGGAKQIDDLLFLKSLFSDIIYKTTSAFELADKNDQLEEMLPAERIPAIRYIYQTLKTLRYGNEIDIHISFKKQMVDCDAFPVLKAQALVNLCSYYLGLRDMNAALACTKEAIMLGQKNETLSLPQGYRLLSMVYLSKQQLSETNEYLGFAMVNAEKTCNYHEMGISSYYASVSQFLYGDIFKAMQLIRLSTKQSLAAGQPDWADRSRFFEGRLEFEMGNYRKAYDVFRNVQQNYFSPMTEEKDTLLQAWIYRSIVYMQIYDTPKPEKPGCDAGLFEIEAAYFSGDFEKAVQLSKSLDNPFLKDNFIYTEQPDWRSGFAQCEYLHFSRGEIQDRMVCAFCSLAVSNLSAEGGEEALNNMQKILRDERLSEMDPWDAFYFYAWYRILEKTGAELVDMNTAVSMAFKRLQRRTSRIGDVETRRQYQNAPRWNRELSLAAKEFRLI
ncbi:MAG: ATP-binding protein [Treponema sp.]|jgi:hypothetical protein|nr:ATP-binding protein [Treponema sp.]